MPADGRTGSAGSMGKTVNMTDTLGHKSVLEKQKAAIEKLRAQNEQLKHELTLENKFSVRPGDPYAQALINRLQDEGDMLARKLVLEMRKTKLLDLHLSETNTTLGTTRSLMGGIYAAKEKVQGAQMQIKLLENRLEKAYVKYNQSTTHNKQLRDQINNLRRERLMFESINSNLEKELQQLKKVMAETIQLANAAFEAKEKAIGEMNVLKVQADKEQQGFEEEWKALSAMIEEDKRERVRAHACHCSQLQGAMAPVWLLSLSINNPLTTRARSQARARLQGL
jgi:coiled-coil domain-containing protein 63/114